MTDSDLVNALLRLEDKFTDLVDANNNAHQQILVAVAKIQTELPTVKAECESSRKRIDDVDEDLEKTKDRVATVEKNLSGLSSKIKILLSILIPAILSAGGIIVASILK